MAQSHIHGRFHTNLTYNNFTHTALCVAGVALGDIHVDFTWQAWHNLTSTVVLRGRRGAHGFSSLFMHVIFRHVLWSLRHVAFYVARNDRSSVFLLWWPWPNVETARACIPKQWHSQSSSFSPHLCVGFLFLILYPGCLLLLLLPPPPPPPASSRTHTHIHTYTITSHTHTNLTYNNFTHTNSQHKLNIQ